MRTALIMLCVAAVSALAGPIAPPPGPVAETYKTLDDVEPRTAIRNIGPFTPIVIDQPGSYYLAENIDALPIQHGIQITVPNVTLDLNGFTIKGDMDAGSIDGVHIDEDAHNCEVKNGVIIGFVGLGMNALNANNGIATGLRLQSNGGGLRAWHGWRVENCVAHKNSSHGIGASHGSTITGCTATENTGHGINAGVGVVISQCSARDNTEYGIYTGNQSVVADCVANTNGWDGIYTPQRCVVRGCTTVGNTQDGIRSVNHSVIIDCVAADNVQDGIDVSNCLVKNCLARANGATNINAVGGSTLIDNH